MGQGSDPAGHYLQYVLINFNPKLNLKGILYLFVILISQFSFETFSPFSTFFSHNNLVRYIGLSGGSTFYINICLITVFYSLSSQKILDRMQQRKKKTQYMNSKYFAQDGHL